MHVNTVVRWSLAGALVGVVVGIVTLARGQQFGPPVQPVFAQPSADGPVTVWRAEHAGHGDQDPEAAKLVQREFELAQQSEQMVAKYAGADEPAREKIKSALRSVLERQFETQQHRREQELAKVEARVNRLKDLIEKRSAAHDTIIDRRLEQLVREADGLGWTAPSGAPDFDFFTGGTVESQPAVEYRK